jgi:hypothetical protein
MIESFRQQVLDILARETKAGPLSEQLFGPQGLFGQAARTPDERRQLLQDPLYRQAMARFMEVQRSEARRFEDSLIAQGTRHPSGTTVGK